MGKRTALFFCFALTSVVAGQDFRATVTGIVADPSGAAIPGATIKATNIANNQVQETTSTVVGLYTIPYLEPGVYNIEATAPGFQTLKRQGITLEVSQKLNLLDSAPLLSSRSRVSGFSSFRHQRCNPNSAITAGVRPLPF
jgi:hypothetical protein